MSFEEFCRLCEKISRTTSKITKIALMADYLRRLDDESLEIAARFLSGRVFPKGSEFEVNVGFSTLYKLIKEVSGLNDKQLLDIYRRHGDLGETAKEALEKKRGGQQLLAWGSPSRLTLKRVYSELEKVAKITGEGSTQKKAARLKGLLLESNPLEAKYIVKLILSELRIGVVEGMVEQAISEAFGKDLDLVRKARLLVGDIGEIAVYAKRDALEKASIRPLRPLEFMLAEPMQSPEEIKEYFRGKTLIAEYKYDGVRAQLHKLGDKVKIFSRRLEDITESFPEVAEEATNLPVKEIILDGEIIGFKNGKPLPFHELQKRLRRKDPWKLVDDVPVVYIVYDIIYLDGKPLIDKPLVTRKKILEEVVVARERMFAGRYWLVSKAEEIRRLFSDSRSEGHEGLMIKDPDSPYEIGKRGRKWVKLKEELDTIDAVVVGAEYGHGKRAGLLSDLIFALWDGDELKVVGKAYTGLTDQEIEWVTRKLKELKIREDGLRVWVRPEIVVEVAFNSVQKSDRHPGGYALRFPRIKRLRLDKSPRDADSVDKLEKLAAKQS